MKKIVFACIALICVLFFAQTLSEDIMVSPTNQWKVQSIDTMKFSRDLAREKLNDSSFTIEIDKQVKAIAETGATHVAIGTPYDEKFIPFLKQWVSAARRYHLNVWFRGNFSGWEGWFDFPKISRIEHTKKVRELILNHPDLFKDGDIFTSCPECENGGPGDPRHTKDVSEYRQFLVTEYETTKQAFTSIKKEVTSNYFSMNGDVARLIMDRETTRKLDGIVTIDHYVKTPEQLEKDINVIAENSGGKIVLGEIGVPIPDIHGDLNEKDQATWLKDTFQRLAWNNNVVGMNYWVNVGGSTGLWNSDAKKREIGSVLTEFYSARVISGKILDHTGNPIYASRITLASHNKTFQSNDSGEFFLPYLPKGEKIEINSPGYIDKTINVEGNKMVVTYSKEELTLLQKIKNFFLGFFL